MKANQLPSNLLDYGTLQGGLVRMMERFREEGTMTGDVNADKFVRTYPSAVLLGMLYDQRVRAEYAFTGPQRLHERIGTLDMAVLAEMDGEKRREIFAIKPAVHRFTNKMSDMTGALAQIIVDEYGGDPSKLWNDGAEYAVIEKRLKALPGFGPQKSYKMKFALHYFGYRDFS